MNARWFAASLVLLAVSGSANADDPRASVVKVQTTIRYPNPLRPWSRQDARESLGSGVVIDGGRILTNAHLVLYASHVFVQGHQEGDRVEATVEAIGPEIDLAVLKPKDEGFFATHPPLPRSKGLPEPMAAVLAYGYPVGGAGVSVTKGIVSRIDYAPYAGRTMGLRVQVDAALNPGNSGGPATVDGKMVGLVFGNLGVAENVGYIIPTEEVDDFLADVADGSYDGKPHFDEEIQSIENEALRGKLGLAKGVTGVMVRKARVAAADYPLKEYDVITKIGPSPIDNEGMVKVRDGRRAPLAIFQPAPAGDDLRLAFNYLVPKLAKDGAVRLTVMRGGEAREIDLPVAVGDDSLFPRFRGQMPSYFIYGPLVFSAAWSDVGGLYLRMNPGLAGRNSPLISRIGDRRTPECKELVVVTSPMFAHRISKGYGDPIGQVVAEVDGVKVKGLEHFVGLLRDGSAPFVTLRFAEENSEDMVFRRSEVEPATAEVLEENGIPRRGSEDLLTTWNRKTAAAR